MKVAVVAEYYPRASDPTLGIWAHKQAVAARDAGAEVHVLVLHRPIPAKVAVRSRDLGALLAPLRQPRKVVLDGIAVEYVRFIAPPRSSNYAAWAKWAKRPLARSLKRLRSEFPFDLVHAHYAAPAAAAVLRTGVEQPLITSVHGGDVLALARSADGKAVVSDALSRSTLVLANSSAIAARCDQLGARNTRVVHLGADLPTAAINRRTEPTLVSVGNLIERKRHADVLRALDLLKERQPELRYVLIGDGPERARLESLAEELGLSERVEFLGRLDHDSAINECWRCSLFVLPSTEEAFGVAYVEAMAGGLPAIGSRGEGGPEEIAETGAGLLLVEPGNVEQLANQIDSTLSDSQSLSKLGQQAQATVAAEFTWQHCGEQTLRAYEDALHA